SITYSGATPTATKAGVLRAPETTEGTPGVDGLSSRIVAQKTSSCPGVTVSPRKWEMKSSLTGDETARDSLSVAPPSGMTRDETFGGSRSTVSASRSSTGTVAREERLAAPMTWAGKTARAKRPGDTRPNSAVAG